jgi:hypothetical protein
MCIRLANQPILSMATTPPLEEIPSLEEIITNLRTTVLLPLLRRHEPGVHTENQVTDSVITQLPPRMRDHSIAYKSAIEEYCQDSQGTEKDLHLPSPHGNTGSTIHTNKPLTIPDNLASGDTAAIIQSFAARLTKTENAWTETKTDLAETKTNLAKTNDRLTKTEVELVTTKAELVTTKDRLTQTETQLVETSAKLNIVNAKVESLEAQIIRLHGERTYVAIRSLFDVAEIPLDAWAQALGNVEAHQCSVSEYVSILANGNWKVGLNMAPENFTTAEGIEQLEKQCRDIMTAGFRVDWRHLVRWAGKFFRPPVCKVTII